MNGLYLHGGFRPYGGTFLTFLDYARNAVRMSALMKLPIIYVYTHDSIGVGEDGPTHQPVEHLTILRSTPNLNTWRPCDGVETAYSWKAALTSQDKPTALILSRQNLEPQKREDHSLIAKGGYLLSKEEQSDLTIIATGSEVQLAMHAKAHLKENGLKANVVSMPCTEIFDQQDDEYKTKILGDGPRVAIECGYPDFWHKYLNQGDLVIGMESFGESAPGSVLMDHFGFTADKVSKKIISFLKK
jgi:transketolase